MTSLTRDYPYLYLGSLRNAREYNELPQWRESHQHNVACKEAIEEAIRNGATIVRVGRTMFGSRI